MVVVSSDMIATEPIPGRLEEIGWTGGEGLADSQMMVDSYRITRDGRIAFGKVSRGSASAAGSTGASTAARAGLPSWPPTSATPTRRSQT
jgi:hypothetical protein